jgi:hypothetical protein
MYRRILVSLDGSKVAEQVLPYARYLAAKLKIPVDLLAVGGRGRDDRFHGGVKRVEPGWLCCRKCPS